MVILGIALLVIGAALLVAEAHLPSYGAIGAGGVVALVAGAAVAVDASGGGAALVVTVAALIGVATAALLATTLRATLAVSHRRASTGAEGLIGHLGTVRRPPAPLGQVLVDGALWRARADTTALDDAELREGDEIVVERVHGLTLCVRRAEEWELSL